MSSDQIAQDIAETEHLRSVLVPRARAMFGFLRKEGDFTQRPSTRWSGNWWTQLIYRSSELGIEVMINNGRRMISV